MASFVTVCNGVSHFDALATVKPYYNMLPFLSTALIRNVTMTNTGQSHKPLEQGDNLKVALNALSMLGISSNTIPPDILILSLFIL